MTKTITFHRLAGRCADGAERDGGRLYHAITAESDGRPGYVALCGAKPGRRSAGWSSYQGEAATCPRCIRLAVQQAVAAVREAV